MAKNFYLMKSEPGEFSITDLRTKGSALWDGIRNYQVRNLIRDEINVGDQALFYHSSCAEVGVVGLMVVVGKPVPDLSQFDPKSKYYDPKSAPDNPRWLAIPVQFCAQFSHLVPLSALRAERALSGLTILKAGNRLSITKVTKAEYDTVVQLGSK
jgi:predicted RNA-binding protein with PUA-like domain